VAGTTTRLVERHLEVVLSDFQQPVAMDLLVGYDAAGQAVWFSEPGETSRAGFGASETHTQPPYAEEIIEVAYWLQDQFFPETRGAWGEPRPRCPGHAHPMAPVEIDGERGGPVPSTTAPSCVSAHSAADTSPPGQAQLKRDRETLPIATRCSINRAAARRAGSLGLR
jgi:hypothetical protein